MNELIDNLNSNELSDEDKQHWLNDYLAKNLVNTSEAAELIHVSRITIENYVKKEKLIPIINRPHNKIFWKSDILQLKKVITDNKKNPRGWNKQK
ncbi:hypothetical protein D8X92_13740 [Listeria ivanovii]|uniref:Helix-turn-helix domain-containing protein n=2 Tax=Listeria TaxID=1637 RepID=A0ABS1G874_LISIV|nr:hypothetical protein [Listeria ivanovii]MBK1962950.1 hypothetical protein [Listeria ivanovii subsp. londoniensis]MBM5721752.1 hypothetical protein [Listeria ivanovii]UCK61729.1 hypothetical protein pLIS48_00266 [Listeria ivanovii]